MSRVIMKYRTWTKTRYANQQGKAGMLLRILVVGLVSAGLVSIARNDCAKEQTGT